MTATIETLHKDGNEIYPTTVADAVVDEDNHTVQQRIDTGVYFLDGGTASVLQPWITNDMIINGTITPAKLDRAYLPLAGGTMTGRLLSNVSGDNTYNSAIGVRTTGGAAFATFSRTDSDAAVGIGVGSAGQNYGVHDRKHNSWMIYNDGTNTHLANNSVETAAIKNEAITSAKVKWSDFTNNTSYIKFGKVAICWGTKTWTVTNQQPYGEANSGDITFPVTYKTAPAVIATPNDMSGACGEYASTSGVSTTKFNIWGGHSAYTAQTSFTARWIAIGEIN